VKLTVIAAVAVGGAVGTLARVSIDLFFSQDSWNDVVSILVVNILGAFLLGLALGHGMAEQPLWVRQGLSIGVLGSFTTMSGIALVTLNLPLPVGVVYLGATVVLGVGAAALGWLLGQRMRPEEATA